MLNKAQVEKYWKSLEVHDWTGVPASPEESWTCVSSVSDAENHICSTLVKTDSAHNSLLPSEGLGLRAVTLWAECLKSAWRDCWHEPTFVLTLNWLNCGGQRSLQPSQYSGIPPNHPSASFRPKILATRRQILLLILISTFYTLGNILGFVLFIKFFFLFSHVFFFPTHCKFLWWWVESFMQHERHVFIL